jgi:hypothetical protein
MTDVSAKADTMLLLVVVAAACCHAAGVSYLDLNKGPELLHIAQGLAPFDLITSIGHIALANLLAIHILATSEHSNLHQQAIPNLGHCQSAAVLALTEKVC